MSEKFKWIDNDIDISSFYDRLSKPLKLAICEAEQADSDGLDMAYAEICDNIEILGKLLVPDTISFKEWDMLCMKYYPVGEEST